ncbi:hypothetical protein ACNOYE_01950 [Nannocystaceae bacterium ST9]
MTTLSLSVSELMLEKIRELIEAGKFRTEEEFARHALAAELRRQARIELDRQLEEGVASEQVEMKDDDWRALEARVIARLDASESSR